jgi:hypothetical protein
MAIRQNARWRPIGDGRRVHLNIPFGDDSVRVPDVVLKCVGYVGEVFHQDNSGIDPDWQGTGFFVSVPGITVPHLRFHVFVTAKHVSEALNGKSVCFAVNKKGGGITHIQGNLGSWWTHPSDPTADVAVLPFNMTHYLWR